MSAANHEWLIPKSIKARKVRLGCEWDGGYVYPLDVRVDALLSYGVGGDISFEVDFRRRFSVPVFCLDPTIDRLPVKDHDGIVFVKEGLASFRSDIFDTLRSHMDRLGLVGRKIALKVDVEGAEWESLKSETDFADISVMVIELHDLCNGPRDLLPIISSAFECFHVHGNNYCGTSEHLPNTVEATFIARALMPGPTNPDMSRYPTHLDFPNNPAVPDIVCNWWQ